MLSHRGSGSAITVTRLDEIYDERCVIRHETSGCLGHEYDMNRASDSETLAPSSSSETSDYWGMRHQLAGEGTVTQSDPTRIETPLNCPVESLTRMRRQLRVYEWYRASDAAYANPEDANEALALAGGKGNRDGRD